MAPPGASGRAPFTAMLENSVPKTGLFVSIVALYAGLVLRLPGQPLSPPDQPRFTGDRLERPGNYREWVWLSSGRGMSDATPKAHPRAVPPFDNRHARRLSSVPSEGHMAGPNDVGPRAARLAEPRLDQSTRSLSGRTPRPGSGTQRPAPLGGGWPFFSFERGAYSAAPIPRSAPCYSCHAQQGAVDNTFVPFYPTLVEIARQKAP